MTRSHHRTDATATDETGAGSKTRVVYYSRTGTTHSVATTLAAHLPDPAVTRIRPRRDRRYLSWLARSAIPGSTVEIQGSPGDLSRYDAVFLGSPKWTLSCPPVNEFIDTADLRGTTVGLFVTYGGFDEERYTRALADRLRSAGAQVPATLRVKRDLASEDALDERVERFLGAVFGENE